MINQRAFAKAYAKSLTRPSFLKTPAFLLKLVFGDMAEEILLGGCSISCEKLTSVGFVFEYSNIDLAFE